MRNWWTYLSLVLLLVACQGEKIPSNPVKEMKEEFKDKMAYTIFLTDMDLQGSQYKHKYSIVDFQKNGEFTITQTDWKNVDDDFFAYHESDFGMEILSKSPRGMINDLVTPPGFTNFVGNNEYGVWKTEGDLTYWDFAPEYDYVKEELLLVEKDLLKSRYDEYQNYYKYNRPYYGGKFGKDSTIYGTYSTYWMIIRPGFWMRRNQTKNFYKPSSVTVWGDYRGGGSFGK